MLICKPHQANLDIRPNESHPCQGTSPGVCRGHEEQAAARSPGARRAGPHGQDGRRTPQSGTAPVPTSQCSCCPHPRALEFPHSPGLPLSTQPQAACIPGITPEVLGERGTQERWGRFFTFAGGKPSPGPLPVLSGNLCKLEISRLGHDGEDRGLGIL